jgi:hypothetical protein
MPLSPSQLRAYVSRSLTRAAGTSTPDSAQISAAFDELCERLRSKLRPLFGAEAVSALFGRALHVAASDHPWIRNVVTGEALCGSGDDVSALSGLDAERIHNGFVAVLAINIELLNTFIGEDLVLPLVQVAWGHGISGDPSATAGGDV